MDQRKGDVGVPEAVADSSSHRRKPLPVRTGSEQAESRSYGRLQDDAHLDAEYVFVEHKTSRSVSPSEFSVCSADRLRNERDAPTEEKLTHMGNVPSQDWYEVDPVASANDQVRLVLLDPSDLASDEFTVVSSPSNSSHLSDASRVLPGSSGHRETSIISEPYIDNVAARPDSTDASDSGGNPLAGGAPLSLSRYDFPPIGKEVPVKMPKQKFAFIAMGPPPQLYNEQAILQLRHGPRNGSTDTLDERSAQSLSDQHITPSSFVHKMQPMQQLQQPKISMAAVRNAYSLHGLAANDENAASTGKYSKEPEGTTSKPRPLTLSSIVMSPASSFQAKARRLTRRCQLRPATIFENMRMTPEEHFQVQYLEIGRPELPRYVNRWNDREIMLVTNGSCVSVGANAKGQNKVSEGEPSAGASFIYKPCLGDAHQPAPITMPFQAIDKAQLLNQSASGAWQRCLKIHEPTGKIALHLEARGPCGDVQKHSSNRAKLRAVIAALDFRFWEAEDWERVVVVTDLEYVALGATKWISLWVKRRWRSAPTWNKEGKMRLGKKIANRDLWEELQSRIDYLHEYGTEVSFWLVPAASNSPIMREAKAAAREAAKVRDDTVIVEEYTKLCGVGL